MNFPRYLILAILVSGWSHPALAQDTLNLWEGLDKPFYLENDLIETEKEHGETLCVFDVTEPTLTIYPAEGENSGRAVVIIPGGNYEVVVIHNEGHDIAKRLAAEGITAAVLKYRIPNPKSSNRPEMVPLVDAQRALKILREKADDYGIEKSSVGVVGFSAGSHLSTVACLWKSNDWMENPNFAGLIYGVTILDEDNQKWLEENLYFRQLYRIDQARNRLLDLVTVQTPPAFLVHAYDDDVSKVEESTTYAQKLNEFGVSTEMHLFPTGGHGFGVGRAEGGTDQWLGLFASWVKSR